jgi:hypothetical protein
MLRRSLERDFPRSDVKDAYQMLARPAPEVARARAPPHLRRRLVLLR